MDDSLAMNVGQAFNNLPTQMPCGLLVIESLEGA